MDYSDTDTAAPSMKMIRVNSSLCLSEKGTR